MKAYCTYCSAQKNPSLKRLPAIKRYQSERISSVYAEAIRLDTEFFIFSGKFGLLHPDDETPYYDHLLQGSEIVVHAKKVANQIKELGLSEIVFFVRPAEQDGNIEVYNKCLRFASRNSNTAFEIREYT